MKPCQGTYCTAVVSNYSRLCDPCRADEFQKRSLSANRQQERVVNKKPPLPRESEPEFTEDSPRFDREYDAVFTEYRTPTGKTTAIALEALAAAISAKPVSIYVADHYEGRPGQVALLNRIQSIADAIGWPIEVSPAPGGHQVRVTAKYMPAPKPLFLEKPAYETHVAKAAKAKKKLKTILDSYKTSGRRKRKNKKS